MRHVSGWKCDTHEEMSFEEAGEKLLEGGDFDGQFPSSLKLWIDDTAAPIADYLGNALNWTIMSDRLVRHLWALIEDCVQIFPAPLFFKDTETRVPGYQVVNVTKVLDCVDRVRSVPWYDDEDVLGGYSELCIDAARTNGAHIFRYLVTPNYVCPRPVCTFNLVNSLVGKGFNGTAFRPCICAET